MTQIRQIAVARPLEADPYSAFQALKRSLSARPVGRWLLNVALRVPVRRFVSRSLQTLAATDQLTFKALPGRPLPMSEGALTVITANLWHDWPRYRRHRQRLETFARLAEWERADVILLQEVARTGDFRADEWLATRLGMAYVYGQANGDNQIRSFEEGVAVLSRYPLAQPSICYLAPRPLSFVRRLAVGVTIKAPAGDFMAVSAHLGHGRKLNTRQLTWLQSWVQEKAGDRPAIVGGDFNTGERSPQIQKLRETWLDLYRAANPQGDGATYRLHWPWGNPMLRMRLDYLFLQQAAAQWQVLEARAVETPGLPHSDHQAVVARLTTEPSGSTKVL